MEEQEGSEDEEAQEGAEEADQEHAEAQPAQQQRRKLQPFEVPTSGAFWLHDDRFEDTAAEEGGGLRSERQVGACWIVVCDRLAAGWRDVKPSLLIGEASLSTLVALCLMSYGAGRGRSCSNGSCSRVS